jgi:DNA-binding transcriptional LysR family regulator
VRAATGDPLLVRSGRALVATPRAMELRGAVSVLVRDAEAVLTPRAAPDLRRLVRTFTLRTSDGFVETFGLALLARLRTDAPNVRLRFIQKADKEGAQIREGEIDLETGVVDETVSAELRAQALFQDRLIGVVRAKHPLAKGKVTAARYATSSHVTVSRPMLERGPIEGALEALGLKRESAIVVGGFASAITVARGSDLVATVPERHTESLRAGMHTFALPVPTPTFTVSMVWHPRLDADPVHRWLRTCVRAACAGTDEGRR